jgi:endonuclease III
MATGSLPQVLAALKTRYAHVKPPAAGRDPLALILWEMVAYLADDDTRGKAFKALRDRVGLAPSALLEASLPVLTAICRSGGSVQPFDRAKRIKLIAALANDEFDGDLSQILTWEYAPAVRALRKFPSVGEPGADRILMLCGSHAVLGLDSNALRVLLRLGYGEESANYTKAYRSARDAAMAVLPKEPGALADASLLLREHGKETCKTSAPRCEECPVTAACAYFSARRGPTPTADRSPRTRSRAPSTRKSPE